MRLISQVRMRENRRTRSIIHVQSAAGQGNAPPAVLQAAAISLLCAVVVGCAAAETDVNTGVGSRRQPSTGRSVLLPSPEPPNSVEAGRSAYASPTSDHMSVPVSLSNTSDEIGATQELPTQELPTTEPSAVVAPPSVENTTVRPATSATPGTEHILPGVMHTWQKWNNCGPSSAMMAMSAFGVTRDQLDIAAILKPDREDTNVSPEELAAYMRTQGLQAIARPNGTSDLARQLVAAGVPVIAEQWVSVDGRGEMGHYRVLIGYDDITREIVAMDSYYGPNQRISYQTIDAEWLPFSGMYVAVYNPSLEETVRSIVGSDFDESAAWVRATARAQEWSQASPEQPWAWFALGEALAKSGDAGGSVAAFDRANAIGLPFRAYWYQFGLAAALSALGEHERLISHADATIETMQGENLEEWHTWRGIALETLGRVDEAQASLERALSFNPNHTDARAALDALLSAASEGG